jgi:hypothetical protein
MVDPDQWLTVLDGHRYVRKVRGNGTVSVDGVAYYVDQTWSGKYVSLRLDAQQRSLIVEERHQVIKALPIKGLVGECLPLDDYLDLITQEARSQLVVGRPIRQQLRLL